MPSSYVLVDHFHSVYFKNLNVSSIDQIKNMYAERKLDRDNLTKINSLAQVLSLWDHKSEEISKRNMLSMLIKY
jgi:hypothetical protein